MISQFSLKLEIVTRINDLEGIINEEFLINNMSCIYILSER